MKDNKLLPQRKCCHYRLGKCYILTEEGGKLVCQVRKCSFFETKEAYDKRQEENGKRQYQRYMNLT